MQPQTKEDNARRPQPERREPPQTSEEKADDFIKQLDEDEE